MNEKSVRITCNETDKTQIISDFNNKSAFCKISKSHEKFEIDHIKPLSSGETNDIKNSQPLCRSCHKEKQTWIKGWWTCVNY